MSQGEVINAINAAFSLVEVQWERLKLQQNHINSLSSKRGRSERYTKTCSSEFTSIETSETDTITLADKVFQEIKASLAFLQSEILSGMQ